MPVWLWGIAAVAALYAAGVLGLVLLGRREDAVAVARFVPDCVVLVKRLARDDRVRARHRWLLLALVAYLLMPFDIVPDVVPVAGALDDAILVVLVLRAVLRDAGHDALADHWPGPPRTLGALLRAVGAPSRP